MKPNILITPNIEGIKLTINENYVRAIELAGGIPLLASYADMKNIDEYLEICDGVLFSGGDDINVEFLNEEPNEKNNAVPIKRDEFEIELLKKCIEKDIPTFCICRGVQVLNVVCGGTLFQHIENHMCEKEEISHKILIKRNTLLFEAIGDVELEVNSVHHQALNKIGNNLKISSFSSDGYIEAVESINNKFILGVQWHPEYLVDNGNRNLNLFKLFIKYCTQ